MTAASLQLLMDMRALDDLIYTSNLLTDTRDWVAMRRCFADTVDFDLSDHVDRIAGKGVGRITDPDVWIQNLEAVIPGFDSTMHSVTNLVHEVKGDTAQSRCSVFGDHFLNNDTGDRHIKASTISDYGSIRTPEGWKIKTWRVKSMYYIGNPSLYALAAEKVSGAERAPLIRNFTRARS